MRTMGCVLGMGLAALCAAGAHAQGVTVNSSGFLVNGDTSSVAALNANPGFDGVITLWEAFEAVNNTPGPGLITVEIASGLTIPLLFPPPVVTRSNVSLASDGTGGFSGGGAGNIQFTGGTNIGVRGLRFEGLFSALRLDNVVGGLIRDCVFDSNFTSIVLAGCGNVAIGGFGMGDPNTVIRDSINGIAIEGGSNNAIRGNHIGTDAANAAGLGCAQGVSVASSAADTVIEQNTVVSNTIAGIVLGNGATGTQIAGNWIGIGPISGMPMGNGVGIRIELGAANSVVSGNNVVHNTTAGVVVDGATTAGHNLQGNAIHDNGTGVSGDAVRLQNGANNGVAAPVLSAAAPFAMGSAAPGAAVDLYVDQPGGQARQFMETVTADAGTGAFSGTNPLDVGSYEGWNLTAMATLGQNSSPLAASITIPATPPSVIGINRTTPQNPTNLPEVAFEVVFSEPVFGIETGAGIASDDFALTDSVGATIAAVAGLGDTYAVTVGTGAGDGTIRLDVLSGGGIEDAAGLPLAADYTDGPAYTMLRLKFLANLVAPAPVPEGGSVTLSVEVEAPGPVGYQWFQDTGAKAPLPVGTDAPTLVLSPISVFDAGDYYVEVTAGPEVLSSNVVTIAVVETEGLPVGGAAGLAMLAAALSAVALRRRRA